MWTQKRYQCYQRSSLAESKATQRPSIRPDGDRLKCRTKSQPIYRRALEKALWLSFQTSGLPSYLFLRTWCRCSSFPHVLFDTQRIRLLLQHGKFKATHLRNRHECACINGFLEWTYYDASAQIFWSYRLVVFCMHLVNKLPLFCLLLPWLRSGTQCSWWGLQQALTLVVTPDYYCLGRRKQSLLLLWGLQRIHDAQSSSCSQAIDGCKNYSTSAQANEHGFYYDCVWGHSVFGHLH